MISWQAPNDHGSASTQYQIEVLDLAGSQWRSDPACDGSLASVVTARQCSIPMLTLTSSPYSYTLGTLITVRVSATNGKGAGPTSAGNTSGATAKTVPARAAAPTRGVDTSPHQVNVLWSALVGDSDTGGLPIVSYQLEYD